MKEWNVPTMIGRMAWARKHNKNHRFALHDGGWYRVCDWTEWNYLYGFVKQIDLTCKACMKVKPRELK